MCDFTSASVIRGQPGCSYTSAYSVPSNSLRPHGLYPVKLLYPWDSPGKNTGVGFSNPGDLPDPGIKPLSLVSPVFGGGFFTTVPPRKLE